MIGLRFAIVAAIALAPLLVPAAGLASEVVRPGPPPLPFAVADAEATVAVVAQSDGTVAISFFRRATPASRRSPCSISSIQTAPPRSRSLTSSRAFARRSPSLDLPCITWRKQKGSAGRRAPRPSRAGSSASTGPAASSVGATRSRRASCPLQWRVPARAPPAPRWRQGPTVERCRRRSAPAREPAERAPCRSRDLRCSYAGSPSCGSIWACRAGEWRVLARGSCEQGDVSSNRGGADAGHRGTCGLEHDLRLRRRSGLRLSVCSPTLQRRGAASADQAPGSVALRTSRTSGLRPQRPSRRTLRPGRAHLAADVAARAVDASKGRGLHFSARARRDVRRCMNAPALPWFHPSTRGTALDFQIPAGFIRAPRMASSTAPASRSRARRVRPDQNQTPKRDRSGRSSLTLTIRLSSIEITGLSNS